MCVCLSRVNSGGSGMLIERFSANTLPVRIDVGRIDHALGRQQVDGADFVVVAEHAPRRARRRARPHRQFVCNWESSARGDGFSHCSLALAATSPTFRTAARCIRPAARLDIDRLREWPPLPSRQPDARSACRTSSSARALTATGRLTLFGTSFFDATSCLWERLCGTSAPLSLFSFWLGQWTDPPELHDATASSHNKPSANGKTDARFAGLK